MACGSGGSAPTDDGLRTRAVSAFQEIALAVVVGFSFMRRVTILASFWSRRAGYSCSHDLLAHHLGDSRYRPFLGRTPHPSRGIGQGNLPFLHGSLDVSSQSDPQRLGKRRALGFPLSTGRIDRQTLCIVSVTSLPTRRVRWFLCRGRQTTTPVSSVVAGTPPAPDEIRGFPAARRGEGMEPFDLSAPGCLAYPMC